ncbi:MAG TPA: chorismate mutase [Solirubrobacterales bacterium]|nr:chorismate mutase [Solirubrobacterales bacterium]
MNGAAAGLEPFRQRLDAIDDQIAKLLGERLEICREVAAYKSEHEIPMMQPERVRIVRENYLRRGAEHDLPEQFSSDLFDLLIATTCRLEDELMDRLAENQSRDAA